MHRYRYLISFLFFVASGCLPIAAQLLKTNVADVKLRDCDDLNCTIRKVLTKGTICEILGAGKMDRLDNYGSHPWWRIRVNKEVGFIFGGLVDIVNEPANELKMDTIGFTKEDKVNLRTCANLGDCGVLTQLPKGVYFKILSKTKTKTTIKSIGEYPWYFIQYRNKRGYVYGGLVTLTSNEINIKATSAKVYSVPDTVRATVVKVAKRDEFFRIAAQSKRSELIRPYGRHYWYQLRNDKEVVGWIYGAHTSKAAEAPVDCQCVDFVKKNMKLTGPTKNAFEWDQVLNGEIPVTINGAEQFLNYKEILKETDLQAGDIAIFDKQHHEVNQQFGHIGLLKNPPTIKDNSKTLLIEGANHQMPLIAYYTRNGCNNVSIKKYRLNEHVRFFRPSKIAK